MAAPAWRLLGGLALCSTLLEGLESGQCVDLGPGRVSTLSFRTELHQLPPDFWSQGVDNSKAILETVLGKIKLYEKGQDRKWADIIQGIGRQYMDVSGGQIWLDDKHSQTVRLDTALKDGLCGLTKPLDGQIEYDCRESEQLYGIGYHKVYESCKLDPLLGNYKVDWGVCLHAHYPWVDLLTSHICVMKSYNNDFIACFCSMNDSSKLDSRGFCITKFECLLNNAGVDKTQKTPFEVSTDCAAHVQYFLEANSKNAAWFGAAQRKDNLRVRAPYHPESPCRNVQFRGQFDIGQLDVNNIEAGIEVYTPFIQNVYNDPETDWIPPKKKEQERIENEGMCAPPDVDPAHQVRMDILSFFFEERIIADVVIWVPGILFLFSSMSEERSWGMELQVNVFQGSAIAIGVYNIMIASLPLGMFTNISEVRQIQAAVCVISLFITTFLNFREINEIFLKVALTCLLPDIVFWKLVPVMYTEERMFNFKIIYISFLLLSAATSTYYVYKATVECLRQDKLSQHQSEENQMRSLKKKVGRKKDWRKSETMKVLKQDAKSVPSTKQDCSRRGKGPAGETARPPAGTGHKKPTGKDNGSLTHTLLDKGPVNKVKRVKKASRVVARSNSETSTSSREDCDPPQTVVKNRSCELVNAESNRLAEQNSVQPVLPVFKTPPSPRSPQCWSWPGGAPTKREKGLQSPGPERQARPDQLYRSHLVERLVEQYCPESVDPACKLPQKSKILTIIRENSHSEDFPTNSTLGEIGSYEEDGGSGFLLQQPESRSASASLVFVPGDPASRDKAVIKANSLANDNLPTLEYKYGCVERLPENIVIDPVDFCVEPPVEMPMTSPLVRILTRQLEGYSPIAVDRTIKEVLHSANSEDLTIPEFRELVVARLEGGGKEIYISEDSSENGEECHICLAPLDSGLEGGGKEIYISEDSSENGEECHICLAPLDSGLEVLEPCGHVFHKSCIASWVDRKEAEESRASCPKCRAVI